MAPRDGFDAALTAHSLLMLSRMLKQLTRNSSPLAPLFLAYSETSDKPEAQPHAVRGFCCSCSAPVVKAEVLSIMYTIMYTIRSSDALDTPSTPDRHWRPIFQRLGSAETGVTVIQSV